MTPYLTPKQSRTESWKSEKVRLRALEPSDASFFHNVRNQDHTHLPISFEATRKWAEKTALESALNDESFWVIEDVKGIVVGSINTYDCKRFCGTFKYNVAIVKHQHRKGFAKEAIKLVCKYYFNELRYQKVNAHSYSFNEASTQMHQKLGFAQEGRLRKMIYTEGQYHDEIIWGLTDLEFKTCFQ